jgi:hypothetical protein
MLKWMLHDILKHEAIIKMFMWMLHDILKCRAKYQNVYVNVTRYSKVQSKESKCLSECYMLHDILNIIKIFMWMLHDILRHKAIIKMFKWMLHVYVNVTWYPKVQSKISKCLCECYTIF